MHRWERARDSIVHAIYPCSWRQGVGALIITAIGSADNILKVKGYPLTPLP